MLIEILKADFGPCSVSSLASSVHGTGEAFTGFPLAVQVVNAQWALAEVAQRGAQSGSSYEHLWQAVKGWRGRHCSGGEYGSSKAGHGRRSICLSCQQNPVW